MKKAAAWFSGVGLALIGLAPVVVFIPFYVLGFIWAFVAIAFLQGFDDCPSVGIWILDKARENFKKAGIR